VTLEHITKRMGGTVPADTGPSSVKTPTLIYDPKTGTFKSGGD